MKTKTIKFQFHKTTTNCAVFKEMPEAGTAPIIGSLYVHKWFCPSMGNGTQAQLILSVQKGGKDNEFPMVAVDLSTAEVIK